MPGGSCESRRNGVKDSVAFRAHGTPGRGRTAQFPQGERPLSTYVLHRVPLGRGPGPRPGRAVPPVLGVRPQAVYQGGGAGPGGARGVGAAPSIVTCHSWQHPAFVQLCLPTLLRYQGALTRTSKSRVAPILPCAHGLTSIVRTGDNEPPGGDRSRQERTSRRKGWKRRRSWKSSAL